MAHSAAWLALIGFGCISMIAFARAKAQVNSVATNTTGRPSQRKSIEPSITALPPDMGKDWRSGTQLEAGWGNSAVGAAGQTATGIAADAWSLEALRVLEWKRFELLCAKYYEAVGFNSQTIRCGADGGIDIKLFKVDPNKPLAVVQCKAWNAYSVGVKEIRELLGVMAHEKVGRGIFITTATYTKDALEFGAANPIYLLDGMGFVGKIKELPKERQDALLKFAFEGDFRTPTCASCGTKMVRRESKRGVFWGCVNYPKCKSTLPIKGKTAL